jgi:glycosyltransferase involved in cell wall biosynthesis
MWTTIEWPPFEWFTGPVDVAHGAFHLLPPSRHARRMATIFDLSNLRCPEMHRAESFGIHAPLLRHAAARADRIVAISESCKTDVVELLGVHPDRVRVVLGGIHLQEFGGAQDDHLLQILRKRFSISGNYLIHLGTLEPRKNLPRMIEAYARVRHRFEDCPRLVLAGQAGWMFEDVFSSIERLRLSNHVVHTGYLERNEAVCLLRAAHACVYPSLYEGFGLPVLEAMAARIPVLTSNVSSMPEVVGDTGILVDPKSVDAIEAGLLELIENRTASRQRVEAAYERAKQFTWENSARALAEVYTELTE